MARVELKGRPIAITGASAGIGRAAALLCAQAGMPVALAARRQDRLEDVAETIRAAGGSAWVMAADAADAAACEAFIRRAEESLGPLYAVFANAGYGLEQPVHEMTDEALRAMFEVNFFGSMNVVRPALPGMIERRRGHVLFCSSCVARFALPYYGVYSATKAAQHHVGRSMRLELAPYGVQVSTVHPVGTKTEFFDVAKERSGGAPLVEHTSERFMQSPDRVARAVVRCLRKPKPEVWTSLPVFFGMGLASMIPRVADAAVRGMVKKRLENSEKMEQ